MGTVERGSTIVDGAVADAGPPARRVTRTPVRARQPLARAHGSFVDAEPAVRRELLAFGAR